MIRNPVSSFSRETRESKLMSSRANVNIIERIKSKIVFRKIKRRRVRRVRRFRFRNKSNDIRRIKSEKVIGLVETSISKFSNGMFRIILN